MSGSVQFTAPEVSVVSAQSLALWAVRVTFSDAIDIATVRPAGFTIAGYPVVQAVLDPSDPTGVVLKLGTNLTTGQTYTVVASGIKRVDGVGLGLPASAEFVATDTGPGFSFTTPDETPPETDDQGREMYEAERVLRRHIPSSMQGKNWNALIRALGKVEQFAWDQAPLVFDQMFVASARGKYLVQRAAEDDITPPKLVGMDDESFRRLVIEVANGKLTIPAFLTVLELFYGIDACRAHCITEQPEPYDLSLGKQQVIIDGKYRATLSFDPADFEHIESATALEAAMAMNKTLRIQGVRALCLPWYDADAGTTKVALYTSTRGMRGSVEAPAGPLGFTVGRHTLQELPRAAYVAQRGPLSIEVVLPATTTVVARKDGEATYVLRRQPLAIESADITGGLVTVQTAAPHGLSPGEQVVIDHLEYDAVGSPVALNGTFRIESTPGPTTLTYRVALTPLAQAVSGIVVTPGIWSADLAWQPPLNKGEAHVETYQVEVQPGDQVYTTGTESIHIDGLSNGVLYTFTVRAVGSAGLGAPATAQVTLAAPLPDVPFIISGTPGDTAVMLEWDRPDNWREAEVDYYEVNTTGITYQTTDLHYLWTSLTNGTGYLFYVRAHGSSGFGDWATVTVTPLATAFAVQNLAAEVNDSAIRLTWDAPTNAVAADVTGYRVTVSPSSQTFDVAAGPLDIQSLTNGTQYTFTVVAVTPIGIGTVATTQATPMALAAPVLTAPAQNSLVTTSTTVAGTSSDARATNILIYRDGTLVSTIAASADFSVDNVLVA